MGYHLAGFEVYGVDIKEQRGYPFKFCKWDALDFPLEGFDAIHASPPCQAFSITKHSHGKEYPDLLTPTLARLAEVEVPWIVENVPGAPPSERCGDLWFSHAVPG